MFGTQKFISKIVLSILFFAASTFSSLATNLVYIPMGSDNKILIIDTHAEDIVGEIDGVTAVHGLASTPDGKFLIAGSFDERKLGSDSLSKPDKMSEDEHKSHHSSSPSDVGNRGSVVSTVSVIDVADKSIVRFIDVPGAVHHVTTSSNGKFALATHPNEGTVSIIDLATYKVVATIPTGPLPNYATFSPDSLKVYVSNSGNNSISEIQTGKWIVERIFNTGTSPEHIVLSQSGDYLYVNNVDEGTTSKIDTKLGKVVEKFTIGSNLHGIDLSDSEKLLFVASRGDDKLVAIDLVSGKKISKDLSPEPYHLATIKNTGKIYVSSADDPKVWVIDQKSLKVTGEIAVKGKGHQLVLGSSR